MRIFILVALMLCPFAHAQQSAKPVRFATFNVSLNRRSEGQLRRDLAADSRQAREIAEIIQRIRPDVLLLNEFDYDSEGLALSLFLDRYLAKPQAGQQALRFQYAYTGPVNTGVPSGRDLDKNGKDDGPADAFGYGAFPGQYGMVVLSRYPLKTESIRTFGRFLWKDMPQADLPVLPSSGKSFYNDGDLRTLRLSSKSHWDVPVAIGENIVHFLVCHPTPPAFDGPEDRNGCRNHDEIRLWADYVSPDRGQYIYDDAGRRGGLADGSRFVIAGDLNADPADGGSRGQAIGQLLSSKRVQDPKPRSEGGPVQARIDGGASGPLSTTSR